jgi:tRNA1Val (adenine37-N6)-methyltransferase
MKKSEAFSLKTQERLDDLQINDLQIIQHPKRFCFGMDAVLLSGFIQCKAGAKVLDMGTGTGIIPILMTAKTDAALIEALEIQEESADMAKRSVEGNHLQERIHITTGDIKTASQLYEASSFDVITSNPPYMNHRHGLKNPALPMAIARHEILCTLEDLVRESAHLLKPGGHFFLIHRPFRLVEIITVLTKYHLEPKRMQLVHPYADREPNMVMIDAVRGGNAMLKIEKPLIIYHAPGKYTQDVLSIYGK